MHNLLLTLIVGLVIEAFGFWLLRRRTRWSSPVISVFVFAISFLAYLPWPIMLWPGADVVAMNLAVYAVVAYLLAITHSQPLPQGEQASADAKSRSRRHWEPWIIIGFFVVVVSVDAVFVTLSMSGLSSNSIVLLTKGKSQDKVSTEFPGLLFEHFYQNESEFNRYLQQMNLQQARGWQVRKGWLGSPPGVDEEAIFQVMVMDSNRKALAGASVHGVFLRSSDSNLDQSFVMDETEPGVYQVKIKLPAPGSWSLRLQIQQGQQLHLLQAQTTVAGHGQQNGGRP